MYSRSENACKQINFISRETLKWTKTAALIGSILPSQSKIANVMKWGMALSYFMQVKIRRAFQWQWMGVHYGGMQWVVLCRWSRMWCNSSDIGPLHPPLRSNASLAEAGDVGFPTRGSHDALSVTARDVVVDLGACWYKETKGNVNCGINDLWGRLQTDGPLLLTWQTEARLVEVAHRLGAGLLLLLLLLVGGGLHGGDGGQHFGGHGHLAHWPVVLAPGDSSQLCELKRVCRAAQLSQIAECTQ